MTDAHDEHHTADPLAGVTDLVRVDRRIVDNAVIVQVTGEVDLVTAPEVAAALCAAEALVVPPAPVVLDLTATVFFGSAGLALISEHAAMCADLGSRLRIVADHAAVLKPMKITGVSHLVEIAPTIAQALSSRR